MIGGEAMLNRAVIDHASLPVALLTSWTLLGAVLSACATTTGPNGTDQAGGGSGSGGSDGGTGPTDDSGGASQPTDDGGGGLLTGDATLGDGAAITSLTIAPANPVLDISALNGVVTGVLLADAGATSIPFRAIAPGGNAVTATWSIDRGELGSLNVSTGIFTPRGSYAGVGTVTAIYGNTTATTTLTIRLHMVQNGGAAGLDGGVGEAGAGGYGGVGGEGPGGPVDTATQTRLRGAAQSPASAAEFGLLYPYDKTVWPRGILPPLVQWQTTHSATAAYIHLIQANFEFEGFYSGKGLIRQPIDPAAWVAALNGNGGDPLSLQVRMADASGVYEAAREGWTIATSPLRGTIYYASYSTALANVVPGATSAAAVLAIKAGASNPVLALPGTQNQCTVCHTVSDDGSTLFAPTDNASQPGLNDYANSASYDLRNNGKVIANYVADLAGSSGTAPDGTPNDRKFLWSGLWKDGTFALQSGGHTQEGYSHGSRIFRRDTANAAPASGLDGVIQEAVTPAFSRDGTKVAFDYWTGTLAPGGGDGHTLDVMSFVCGPVAAPAAGAPSCGSFAFSNLRRLYTNSDAVSGYVGWPAWLPDSSGIVFHNTMVLPANDGDSPLSTWHGAKAKLWFVDVPADPSVAPQPIALDALNGDGPNGASVLPAASGVLLHGDDDRMNYEPTVNPIASGGYAWVVFTSRRMYGNVAQGDPYAAADGVTAVPKKLWIAAIDTHPTPGHDPSHPAFYLPGQELSAGNMRGFWAVDPCRADGASCETGDECCGGYCRPTPSGALACGNIKTGCAQEFEKCTQTSDCCGAAQGFECTNSVCSRPAAK